MADSKCEGTCVFHEQYEAQTKEVHSWHLGAKVEIMGMHSKMDGIKDDLKSVSNWLRVVAGTLAVAVIVQIVKAVTG